MFGGHEKKESPHLDSNPECSKAQDIESLASTVLAGNKPACGFPEKYRKKT